jgi:hypothetical protein
VWGELTAGEGAPEALREVRDTDFFDVVEGEESNLFTEILDDLDRGETAAAKSQGEDPQNRRSYTIRRTRDE